MQMDTYLVTYSRNDVVKYITDNLHKYNYFYN